MIPYSFAKQQGILLQPNLDGTYTLHYRAGLHAQSVSEVYRVCPTAITATAQASAEQFQQLLAQIYQRGAGATAEMVAGIEEGMALDELIEQMPATQDLLEAHDDAPVIRLLNALLTQAIKQKASDIHIESFADNVSVRFRTDGVLQEILSIPPRLAPLVISRVKVMAKLDIAEKRVPQDGRMSLSIASHNIDVRVSTLPGNHGERVVMRILDQQTARLDVAALGMNPAVLAQVKSLLQASHGIILVTGPTGSGKTTSLYAMLSELNDSSRNILTIEDPIEYDLPGIGQTPVNTKTQMSFARGLRAILRQDPDVVMVGEIRDQETAEIAVQASLTGHLVFSTLHTNSALGAITRLRDMGVAPFLLASSLHGVIAQRLVRKLCEHCRQPVTATVEQQQWLGQLDPKIILYEPLGCPHCNNTGYRGRTGLYESISIDTALAKLIHDEASEDNLRIYIRQRNPSIRQDGIEKVLNGETSYTEVLRVIAI